MYLAEANVLEYAGGYAVTISPKKQKVQFKEGLLGQAAESGKPIYIDGLHEEALVINSAIVNKKPDHLMVVPFDFEGKTMGVIEIGSLNAFSETDKEFIESCLESIAISINSAIARKKIQMLLEETQVQSEELQSQQEELRQMNEELEEQTQGLKQQQEELQIANEELEEQTQALEMKNKELEFAKHDIEEKRRQIEISSKYKSEFLANMSHELRTPLNSLLILSKDLSENRNNNLTSDQVECAEIIYNSGHDLLNLINEVLDLSKIEAGKMTLQIEKTYLQELADTTYKNFKHQADKKKLGFKINIDKEAPEYIMTDRLRLDQVIKNLISNAIKFTDKGEVEVSIKNGTENTSSIAVKDTGIGIPEDKQQYIFEAFQQADGGTSRKYGGTGLGLSISRELVKLLGADIKLESKPSVGSTFTLTLPLELVQQEDEVVEPVQPKGTDKQRSIMLTDSVVIPDDRYQISEEDNIVLIIEDDLNFAKILLRQAQQKGFKGIVASTGETGLLLAEEHRPHAIIMDMNLPGIKGDKVIQELKKDPLLKHIPVHIISGEDCSLEMINNGAIEYLTKPIEKDQLEEAFNRIENVIDRKMKNVLIIEADKASRTNISGLIAGGEVKCLEAQTGKEAIKLYGKNHIDCIILDLDFEDTSGIKLIYELEKLKPEAMPPVIVYTGRLLTKDENDELLKCTETVIIKGAKSEERLLNETALFLHRTISTMPESRNRKISNIQDKDALFKSKKVLLVDDDMRNVFALSKILKERGLEIVKAENGYSALNALDIDPAVDIVLMDIMMPEMDGYETMQKIRRQSKFKNLPIIALTAKAMKEDRQKCIDAGANDYITKPVDVERLLSLMRVWLSK
jgi:signal transduction histidine kinase/CheY-like chemotaxis protein